MIFVIENNFCVYFVYRFPCFRSELINDTAFLRFHLEVSIFFLCVLFVTRISISNLHFITTYFF